MTSPSLQTAPSFSTRQTTTGLGRLLVLALITFVIYFVTGTTEHLATPLGYDGRGTLWWACGWAVALTFIFGKVALPGVFLGELVTAFLIVNGPPWLHFVTATGNTLEAALGAERDSVRVLSAALREKKEEAERHLARAKALAPLSTSQRGWTRRNRWRWW